MRALAPEFLMNAEEHYLHAYYMTESANGLLPLLRRVGLERHAVEVERILARRVGKGPLREIMSGWRNKWLVLLLCGLHPLADAPPASIPKALSTKIRSGSWQISKTIKRS
jgi:hypothetical protein